MTTAPPAERIAVQVNGPATLIDVPPDVAEQLRLFREDPDTADREVLSRSGALAGDGLVAELQACIDLQLSARLTMTFESQFQVNFGVTQVAVGPTGSVATMERSNGHLRYVVWPGGDPLPLLVSIVGWTAKADEPPSDASERLPISMDIDSYFAGVDGDTLIVPDDPAHRFLRNVDRSYRVTSAWRTSDSDVLTRTARLAHATTGWWKMEVEGDLDADPKITARWIPNVQVPTELAALFPDTPAA